MGNMREEVFYFNFTEEESLAVTIIGSETLEGAITRLLTESNYQKIYELIGDIVKKSVGRMSEDGRKFVKNQDILDDFTQTNAYSDFMMELMSGEEATGAILEFLNGIIPNKTKKNLPGGKVTEDMLREYQQNPANIQALRPPSPPRV